MKTRSEADELLEGLAAGGLHPIVVDEDTDLDSVLGPLLDGSLSGRTPSVGATRMTNTECVDDMMEYSAFGAMAQLVIMTAIEKYCQLAAVERLEEGGMINPDAWQGAAKEILGKLDKHYGRAG